MNGKVSASTIEMADIQNMSPSDEQRMKELWRAAHKSYMHQKYGNTNNKKDG